MIILKFLIAIVGLIIIIAAIASLFLGLTEELGMITGIISAAIVFAVFRIDGVNEFFGMDDNMLDQIALLTFVGGGIISSFSWEKLGGAMITAGWVAVGLILLQIVPMSFISNIIEVAAAPFVIACIPIFLIIVFFKM